MTPLEILLLILVIVAIGGGGWRYGPWRTPAEPSVQPIDRPGPNILHILGIVLLIVVVLALLNRGVW